MWGKHMQTTSAKSGTGVDEDMTPTYRGWEAPKKFPVLLLSHVIAVIWTCLGHMRQDEKEFHSLLQTMRKQSI